MRLKLAEWPKMYCAATDEFRPVTQKDVDDMVRALRVYGSISEAVKRHSEEVNAENGYRQDWVRVPKSGT